MKQMKVKLEDVCERGTSNLKQSDIAKTSGDYPIYGASGYIGNTNFYHQEKPYVAVVKDGAGVGRAALYPANSSVIGTMQYLLPKDNVLPKYLFYVVSYMHLEKYFTGATIPHIYFKDYKNEEFNLDLLERQAEIVEILEKCEKIIEKRKQEIQLLDQLIKARFAWLMWMRLEDICTVFTDGDWIESKDQADEGIRLIQTGNIGMGAYLEKEEKAKYISEETFNKLKCTEIFSGDILVSRLPEPVGRACIIPEKKERMITAVDCTICRSNEAIVCKEYLCYFMRSNAYYTRLLNSVTGTTRKRISRKNLGNVELDIPSKREQEKVVKQLDCLVKVISSRITELQRLDDLIKARFVEMFGHQSHNEKSLPYMTVDDVAEIYLGITHTPTYVDSGVMFIAAKNTSGDFLDLTDVKYISREEFEGAPKGSKPQVNDVLFSRVGSNLGHPVILEEELELCTFVSLGFLRSKGIVTSNYLKHWMRDEFFAKQVSEHVKGGGQPNLNTGWLKEFKIIVPNLEKQKEFDDFCHQVTKSKLFEFSSLQNHTGMLQ